MLARTASLVAISVPLAVFVSSRLRLMSTATIPKNREGWLQALDSLPASPARIPAFFFAHGSPMLAFPESETKDGLTHHMGPNGPLGSFLRDFGPALLKKYNPKGIAVFSAHWETTETRVG